MNPEIFLVLVVVAGACCGAWFRWRWTGCWERPLAHTGRRRAMSIAIAALLPLVLRAVLLPLFPAPEPRVHDEFSFLLAADTFAQGRLVNPQHPFWMHFESIHILSRPVYASAFPIGPAILLAIGKVLFANAWAGVWIGCALMCGAICWMLQEWLPPRWALLGALLAVLRFGVSSYWMNSYWGGCLAAAGGALVLGAMPRILRAPAWSATLAMSAGLVILANTRPVEGAFFALLVGGAIAARLFAREGPPLGELVRRVVAPLALVLVLAGVALGYYCAHVTGKPWVAPYVLYRNTMTMAPHFLFQTPTAEPIYNNREVRNFYTRWEMLSYTTVHDAPLPDLVQKTGAYWRFHAGPLFTLPLLLIPALRRTRAAPLLFIAGAFPLVLLPQIWHNAHYAAPATGLVLLLVVMGMRQLRCVRWRGRRVGLYAVRCLPWACVAMLLIRIAAGTMPSDEVPQVSWRWPLPGGVERGGILRQLRAAGGRHLVFVRYGIAHDHGSEWVYNDADIDRSAVVWARELDAASNAKLMRYFADRTVWSVEPDAPNSRAIAYRDAKPVPMPFVQIGAPGIEVLRSPEQVKRKMYDLALAQGASMLGCDAWSYLFTEATGVAGPDLSHGCWGEQGRQQLRTLDEWFGWALRQRE